MAVPGRPTEVRNITTRRDAEHRLEDEIVRSVAAGERLLIGCDAGLGYPAGTAAAFDADRGQADIEPWRALWALIEAEIVDDEANRNNRFVVAAVLNAAAQRHGGVSAGPFWGAPPAATGPTLSSTKPRTVELEEFRLAERELRATGRRPASMWQLLGAGSVGSQSLTLIPVLERLRRANPDTVAVWPYEHERIGAGAAPVVIAEIWPTMFGLDEAVASRLCRDAGQVHRMAEVALEFAGRWLTVPSNAPESALTEEGWVLGVPWPDGGDPSPDSATAR